MRDFVVVFAEHVAAEIMVQIAPDGVDVVGVVLGVVEFQQERLVLDAIVMSLSRFDSTGPGEVEVFLAGLGQLGEIGIGQFLAVTADIFLDDLLKDFLLGRIHLGSGKSHGFEDLDLAAVAGDDLLGCDVGVDDHLALFLGKGMDQGVTEIILNTQHAQSGAGPVEDLGGIGAKERRRDRNIRAFNNGEIEGEMMALHAPAPGIVPAGFAENGDVIQLGIADRSLALLKIAQDIVEAHDGGGLEVTALAEGAAEQGLSEQPLGGGHFLEREAFADERHEIPILAFRVIQAEGGLGGLFGGQGGEEILRCGGHFLRRGIVGGR